ncbi:MAG: hypothetical protein A2231_12290 [Candidatus Firestonebacteria bacterium RIFOXYA2_FULL_40_8]|nr:MAG: hypothetical protein A2231_12290 [Candidatus Firestonebacteria bacterium RIFOXYA2_FULL_40_8]
MAGVFKKMKILIAVNNSSVGAVKNAVTAAEKLFPEAEITLLAKESAKQGFKTFFENCAVISYAEGKTVGSAESLISFFKMIRSSSFEIIVIVNEKDNIRDSRLDVLSLLSGFKKCFNFDAVKNKMQKRSGVAVISRLVFSGLLPAALAVYMFIFLLLCCIFALPGYLLRGEVKTAVAFFIRNIFNLAGYLLLDLRQAVKKSTIDYFIYWEFCGVAYRRKAFDKSKIKKILVIKIEHLGDLVLSVPMLKALRSEFPNAKIYLLVSPWNRTIAESCLYVDKVIIYKTNNPVFNRGRKHRFIFFRKLFFFFKLSFAGYDLTLDTGGWIETFEIAYRSNAWFMGALDYKRVNNLINIRLAEFEETDNELIRSFKLLALFDIKGKQDAGTEYWINPQEIASAGKSLAEKGITDKDVLVGFYAGGSFAAKRWGRDNFAKVINALPVQSGLKVIIFNAPGEQEYMEGLIGQLSVPFILMPEKQSLKEFAGVVTRCRIFVSGDGGLSHLATAMKVKSVTLFGPGNEKEWGAYCESRVVLTGSYPCSPCNGTNCIRNLCMEAITTEEVLEAVKCGLE